MTIDDKLKYNFNDDKQNYLSEVQNWGLNYLDTSSLNQPIKM